MKWASEVRAADHLSCGNEVLSLGELWLFYGVVSRFAAPELPDLPPSGYCPLQPNSKHWFTASFGVFFFFFFWWVGGGGGGGFKTKIKIQ